MEFEITRVDCTIIFIVHVTHMRTVNNEHYVYDLANVSKVCLASNKSRFCISNEETKNKKKKKKKKQVNTSPCLVKMCKTLLCTRKVLNVYVNIVLIMSFLF